MKNTEDILNDFKLLYKEGDFRVTTSGIKTIEIQNAHFLCDKPWIVREPNYDYAQREIEWYLSKSRNVNDIPGGAPKIWKDCADKNGMINSNYGWCIFSEENHNQFYNCVESLKKDPMTRQAVMLYTRPSMWEEWNKNGMRDFICTYSVQCFMNKINNEWHLKYIVYMRSNDAVFGFNNDCIWHNWVRDFLASELENTYGKIICDPVEWNAGSLHIYERHFKYLENND